MSEPCVSLVNFWVCADVLSCACQGHDYASISSEDVNWKAAWCCREAVNAAVESVLHYSNVVLKVTYVMRRNESVRLCWSCTSWHCSPRAWVSHKVVLSSTRALQRILCTSGFASCHEMSTNFELGEATKIGFVVLLLIMQLECAVPYLSVSGQGWGAGFRNTLLPAVSNSSCSASRRAFTMHWSAALSVIHSLLYLPLSLQSSPKKIQSVTAKSMNWSSMKIPAQSEGACAMLWAPG